MGALGHPRQPLRAAFPLRRTVLDIEADAVVLDPEPQPVLLEVEADIHVMG